MVKKAPRSDLTARYQKKKKISITKELKRTVKMKALYIKLSGRGATKREGRLCSFLVSASKKKNQDINSPTRPLCSKSVGCKARGGRSREEDQSLLRSESLCKSTASLTGWKGMGRGNSQERCLMVGAWFHGLYR